MHSPLGLSHQRSIPSLPPLTRTAPVGPQANAYTIPGCSDRTRTRSPQCISHTNNSPPSLLPPPEASHFPSRLQATSFTLPCCPPSCMNTLPSVALHPAAVPSSP